MYKYLFSSEHWTPESPTYLDSIEKEALLSPVLKQSDQTNPNDPYMTYKTEQRAGQAVQYPPC